MVGNGKGVYGFGVGYGNTITTARADAAMQALKRLQVGTSATNKGGRLISVR